MPQKNFKIKDLPKADRPREKLISKGPQNLKDEELLSILNNSYNILYEKFYYKQ